MKILGVCHDVFICSACVVVDGIIIAAIAEERLDRNKMSRVFPLKAIEKCLEISGMTIEDIDEVAVAWNPGIEMETVLPGYLSGRVMRAEHMIQVPARFMQIAGVPASQMFSLNNLWEKSPPITFIDHYMAHVGSAFYLSPFRDCAILILDGRGEKQTCLLASGNEVSVEKIAETDFPHSLGLFYSAVTQFLGFQPDSDEWKVMALASYTTSDNEYFPKLKMLVNVNDDGSLKLDLDYFEFYNLWKKSMYSNKFIEVFEDPRSKNEKITLRHHKIAAALQRVFEESITRILTILHERTDNDRVALSGGCFMNSVYNGKILELTPFKECFISSCPDDSGTSIGAALYLEAVRSGRRFGEQSLTNFWGEKFSEQQLAKIVKEYKLPNSKKVKNPSKSAANDIENGKLVGWFQGRSEFGQRALGNRSILADPRKKEMKDLINNAVKFRESFRPFAPAILAERVSEYFECSDGTRVPFMEKVIEVRKEKRDEIPSVVHVDGSGRLQTVHVDASPRFHELIKEFEKLTGTPIVLNTSFNLNGEPIVNNPTDAIRTFFSCGLDILYLGNIRIEK